MSKILPIPLRNIDSNNRYSLKNLLSDGSINLNNAELVQALSKLSKEKVTKLGHVEVRYEVTDRCNASCIMCPRDEHEHGREHGAVCGPGSRRACSWCQHRIDRAGRDVVLLGTGRPRGRLYVRYSLSAHDCLRCELGRNDPDRG